MILIFVLFVICMTGLILKIAKKFDRKVSSYLIFGIRDADAAMYRYKTKRKRNRTV